MKHIHRWEKWSWCHNERMTWMERSCTTCGKCQEVHDKEIERILNCPAPRFKKVMYREDAASGVVTLDRIGSLKNAQRNGVQLFERIPAKKGKKEPKK